MLEVNINRKLAGFTLNISFVVEREIMAIIGPSGSGKTMTLSSIAGLVQPDEGYIRLNDKVLFDSNQKINLHPQKRKVGFVFQDYALFPHLRVNDNIAYGIRNKTPVEISNRVSQLLEKMNLRDLGQRFPTQLSGGQQQRVALARALAPEPDLLLLDEPFSALDTQVKERLQLELLSIQNFYKGHILFVTHNLSEGYKIASRLAVYDSGKIIQCDNKQKVIDSPANKTVARLTGVRNLYKGTVLDIKDNYAIADIPELGEKFKVEIKDQFIPELNQKVVIGIRPEYVHLSDNPVENTVKCRLERVVDGISSAECFFYLPGATESRHWIEAILTKSDVERVKTQREYYLHIHPEYLNIFRD